MSKGEFFRCEGQNACSNTGETDASPMDRKSDHVDRAQEPVLKKSLSTASTVSINDSSISSFDSTDDFRKVHFSIHNDTIIEDSSFSCEQTNVTAEEDGDRPDLWYKREELRQFKMEARQTAQLVRSNPRLLALIHSSHDLSIFIAEYGGRAQEAPEMASVSTILAAEVKSWVTATTMAGDTCRGLESILLREQRGAFAQDARDAVVEAVYRTDDDARNMAEKYNTFSLPATTFAQAMATADAIESAL